MRRPAALSLREGRHLSQTCRPWVCTASSGTRVTSAAPGRKPQTVRRFLSAAMFSEKAWLLPVLLFMRRPASRSGLGAPLTLCETTLSFAFWRRGADGLAGQRAACACSHSVPQRPW